MSKAPPDDEVNTSFLRPLTKFSANGTPYQRDSKVNYQIVFALSLTPEKLIECAKLDDSEHPDYFREEVLVYLIREAHLYQNNNLLDALSEILLRRIVVSIRNRLQALGGDAEQAYDDVIVKLFTRILDFEKQRGDFFQVRFKSALKTVCIDVYRRYNNKRQILYKDQGGESEDSDDVQEERIRPVSLFASESVLDNPENIILMREALETLPEPIQTTYILRHKDGWKIETIDPDTPSLSEHFKVTPRTIRNRLDKAEKILDNWRKANYV